MKTSLSLTDQDRQIAEGLQRRLGMDSLSETVRFALRHAALEAAVLQPKVVGSDGSAADQATEKANAVKEGASAYGLVSGGKAAWGYGGTGRVSDPFKIAAKNIGRPVAFVSFKKAILDAYAPKDDPTERVYVEYAAKLSKQMGIPVPPGVIGWHLSGHKRWRRLVALARHAIEKHGEASFQTAAEVMYNGDPQPMLDMLYPKH